MLLTISQHSISTTVLFILIVTTLFPTAHTTSSSKSYQHNPNIPNIPNNPKKIKKPTNNNYEPAQNRNGLDFTVECIDPLRSSDANNDHILDPDEYATFIAKQQAALIYTDDATTTETSYAYLPPTLQDTLNQLSCNVCKKMLGETSERCCREDLGLDIQGINGTNGGGITNTNKLWLHGLCFETKMAVGRLATTVPSNRPSDKWSSRPSGIPTKDPSDKPSNQPSHKPSDRSTNEPSNMPSMTRTPMNIRTPGYILRASTSPPTTPPTSLTSTLRLTPSRSSSIVVTALATGAVILCLFTGIGLLVDGRSSHHTTTSSTTSSTAPRRRRRRWYTATHRGKDLEGPGQRYVPMDDRSSRGDSTGDGGSTLDTDE